MGLKNTINSLLKAGTTLDGNPGQDLFTGSNAGNISVAKNILNNTTLLAVGELKNSGGISLGENSIINKITNLFNDKGALISTTNSAEKFYLKASDTNTQIQSIQGVQGVNMEDEAANLLMFQKAFGANSRAFSAINQSIEDIFTFIS